MSHDYLALAAAYQADVIAGRVPAGKWVQLACERNQRDLARQDTPSFPYRFDDALGGRICLFAEMLPHVKGPKAFVTGKDDQKRSIWNTIVLEPWQCWVLSTLFGWVRVKDGRRRFRIALILVPRKNAKSTLAAAAVLYMLVADGESGAECYSAATSRDQAKVIGEIAWEMARRSPTFREAFGVKMGSKTSLSLHVPATGSKFAPLSADAHTLDGLNISFAALDELHAHKSAAVWDVINTATGARPQPMILAITTAGVDLGGICHRQLGILEKVLEGVFTDDTYFGTNYTIDAGDDYRLPISAAKANPNLGVSVDAEDLAGKVHAASHSPAAVNAILTKHFNVWIRTESAWMSASQWQACAKPEWAGLNATAREQRAIAAWSQYPCWIGVDLAEVRDIAALVALFKTGPDTYAIIGRYYLPAQAVDKSPIAELSGWVREGFIIETPGDQADFGRIQADLLAWCDLFQVQEIDFDRALAAQMQQQLKAALEAKIDRDAADRLVITVPQTTQTMDPAMKRTERLVLARGIEHDGNPAMGWMISNVVVERNYKDEIYPRKAGGKDSANKIDGPVAMWTAMSQAMMAQAREPQFQMIIVGGR